MDIPAWLPGVVTAVSLNAIQYAVFTGRAMQRLDHFKESQLELKEAVALMQDAKLDVALHQSEVKRMDGRVDTAFQEISRERHRVNNIEQRKAT